MKFRDPISAEQLKKLDRDAFNSALENAEEEDGLPLEFSEKLGSSIQDFRYTYVDYRLEGSVPRVDQKDDQQQLNDIVDRVREEFGPKRGDEAIRTMIKVIDRAIGEVLGEELQA